MADNLSPSIGGTLDVRNATSRHPLAKACDQCHRCKVACGGERPSCGRCRHNGSACTYSTGKPIGKPKGSKNKKRNNDLQRSATNLSEPEPTLEDSIKRKPSLEGPSHHKRQRSSIYISVPPSPSMNTSRHTTEPELSSGPPASGNVSDDVEIYTRNISHNFSTANSEITKLHLSPEDIHEIGVHQPFDFDNDLMDMSDLLDIERHHRTLTSALPSQDPEFPSFTPPGLPTSTEVHASDGELQVPTRIDSPIESNALTTRCYCASESLDIIPELERFSSGKDMLSADSALSLTRRGKTIISNHLGCPHHSQSHLLQTSLLAYILILYQVSGCYSVLRYLMDDSDYQKSLPVSVGALHVDDTEARKQILNVVLEAEIRDAISLSKKLHNWTESLQSATNAHPCEPLLSAVRQELENSLVKLLPNSKE